MARACTFEFSVSLNVVVDLYSALCKGSNALRVVVLEEMCLQCYFEAAGADDS